MREKEEKREKEAKKEKKKKATERWVSYRRKSLHCNRLGTKKFKKRKNVKIEWW